MACPSSMASERKPPELTPSTTFDNISRKTVEVETVIDADTLDGAEILNPEESMFAVFGTQSYRSTDRKVAAKDGDVCLDRRVIVDAAQVTNRNYATQFFRTLPKQGLVKGFTKIDSTSG